MKKLHFLLGLIMLLNVFSVWGDEKITIIQGESETIQLPFVLKSYRILPTDSKVFKVEELDPDLRIIANTIGEANLVVNGIAGDQRIYSIVVKSNLMTLLRKLRNDLKDLTELEIAINEDRIVVRGTVTNPDHWSHLQRVMATYKDKTIVNYTSFSPSSDALMDLKKRLQDAGFVFAETREDMKDGELFLYSKSDTVFISGKVFNEESKAKVEQSIQTAPIIAGNLVKKVLDITVVKPLLTVEVAFVSVSDSDNFTRTGNVNPIGMVDASFFRRWFDGSEQNRTTAIGTSMGSTLSLLQSNLVSKVMEQASISFPNGGSGNQKFGGTVKVPVSGVDNGDLKDVTFGYSATISGGLTSASEVELQMTLSQQDVITDAKGNYVQKDNSVEMTLPLEMNKTFVISHHKKLTEMSSEVLFPVLGRIPVLNWFFSDKANRQETVHVLVLVSASIQDRTTDKKIELNSQEELNKAGQSTKDLIDKPIGESISKDVENILH